MLWEKSVSISTVFNATLMDCVNFQIRWINDYMKLYGGQTYFQLLNSSQRVKCLCASAATTSCQGHPITVDLFTKTLSKNQSKKKSIAQNRSCGYFTFGCFKGFWQQTFVCSWSSWWTNLYFLLHSSLTTRSQPCLETFQLFTLHDHVLAFLLVRFYSIDWMLDCCTCSLCLLFWSDIEASTLRLLLLLDFVAGTSTLLPSSTIHGGI